MAVAAATAHAPLVGARHAGAVPTPLTAASRAAAERRQDAVAWEYDASASAPPPRGTLYDNTIGTQIKALLVNHHITEFRPYEPFAPSPVASSAVASAVSAAAVAPDRPSPTLAAAITTPAVAPTITTSTISPAKPATAFTPSAVADTAITSTAVASTFAATTFTTAPVTTTVPSTRSVTV